MKVGKLKCAGRGLALVREDIESSVEIPHRNSGRIVVGDPPRILALFGWYFPTECWSNTPLGNELRFRRVYKKRTTSIGERSDARHGSRDLGLVVSDRSIRRHSCGVLCRGETDPTGPLPNWNEIRPSA